MSVKFKVVNMKCNNCKEHVTHALESLAGVEKVEVVLPKQEVTVTFEPSQVTPKQMIQAMADVNYQADIIDE